MTSYLIIFQHDVDFRFVICFRSHDVVNLVAAKLFLEVLVLLSHQRHGGGEEYHPRSVSTIRAILCMKPGAWQPQSHWLRGSQLINLRCRKRFHGPLHHQEKEDSMSTFGKKAAIQISIAYLALVSQKVLKPWDISQPNSTYAPPPSMNRRKDINCKNITLAACVIRMREVLRCVKMQNRGLNAHCLLCALP